MGKFKSIVGKVWEHKYLFTFLFFLIIVGFIDTNSLLFRYQLYLQNKALKEEIAEYEAQFAADTRELETLRSHPDAVEEVARVRLFMKTDNEDVYVVE